MSEELKIVIVLKEKAASVGIQKPDCDPFLAKVEGDLPAVLKAVPMLVTQARKVWETNPLYPECKTQLAPPPPAVAQKATPKAQPVMF